MKRKKKKMMQRMKMKNEKNRQREQGRIHGNSVADGWAGAVMRKPLEVQKCDGRTDLPTDTARCRLACPRLKKDGILVSCE